VSASAAVVILGSPTPSALAASSNNSAEWPLDDSHFHAQQAWRISQGAGVTVAVVDSGVDSTHPDLVGQLVPGTGFVGVTGDTGYTDASGDSHGTSIAGIIAGTGTGTTGSAMTGLAPKATILPVRVSLDNTVEPVSLAKGVFYAVDHHARIINVSEGTPTPNPTVRAAITYALNHNVLVVAAAGNSGQQGNPPEYPAAFAGVVSVAGVTQDNQPWADSESGPTIALAAPAAGIYSAADDGNYLTVNGTSYGAPYVCAAAALVWSAHPGFTPGQVIRQLTTTADHHGATAHDDHYGYGTIDPLRALTASPVTDTTNPLLAHLPAAVAPGSDHSGLLLWAGVAGGLAIAGIGALIYLLRRRRSSSPSRTAPSPNQRRTTATTRSRR
jgi:type VII secretion-associated serine protease mycosin